jgi:hypothetical protein
MRKTFKLRKPIMVEGRTVNELDYDEEEITVSLYGRACEQGAVPTSIKEINDKLHVMIFWAAVMAVNHEVEFTTLNQVKGIGDILAMGDIGRNFIMRSEGSKESDSEEPSENTLDDSTQASPSSENID